MPYYTTRTADGVAWMKALRNLFLISVAFTELSAAPIASNEPAPMLDDFIELTATAPIEFGTKSITSAEFVEGEAAWVLRIFTPILIAELGERGKEPQVVNFVERLLSWWGRAATGVSENQSIAFKLWEKSGQYVSQETAEHLASEALKLAPKEANYPILQFFVAELFRMKLDHRDEPARLESLRKLESSNPAILFLQALVKFKAMGQLDIKQMDKDAGDILLKSLSSDWIHGNDINYIVDILVRRGRVRAMPHAGELSAIIRKSKIPEWARNTIAAHQLLESVSQFHIDAPERKRAVAESRELLLRAWDLNPNRPEAAAALIWVSAFGPEPEREARTWFDRAVAVQCDYPGAYQNMFRCFQYTKNGSASLGFGLACSKVPRRDVIVHEYLLVSILGITKEMQDWRVVLRKREVAERIAGLFNEKVESSKIEAQFTHYSILGVLMNWMAGNFVDAAVHESRVRSSGRFPWPDAIGMLGVNFGIDMRRVAEESAALGFYQSARGASEALEVDDFATAEKSCATALAEIKNGSGASWVKGMLDRSMFSNGFARGKWMPVPGNFACWFLDPVGSGLPGGTTYSFATKAVVPTRKYLRIELGDKFDLKGKLKLPAGGKKAGFVFVLGHVDEFYAGEPKPWAEFRFFANGDKTSSTQFALSRTWDEQDRQAGPEVGDTINFRFRRNGNKVSFWIDEKPVVEGQQVPFTLPSGAMGFGIGGTTFGEPSNLSFENLEAQKLGTEA